MNNDRTPKEDVIAVNVPVREDGSITLPDDLRARLHINPGDEIRFVYDDEVEQLIVIPRDQRGFWTEEWIEGEREADEDLAAGRFKRSHDLDEMFDDLDRGITGLCRPHTTGCSGSYVTTRNSTTISVPASRKPSAISSKICGQADNLVRGSESRESKATTVSTS
jgi:antitoxin PrlF